MSAEGTQHRKGQLSPQPQTVCPPPLWEALQGPPFPDQQVQEQLHSYGCHSTKLHGDSPPPHLHQWLYFPPPPWLDCHHALLQHWTLHLYNTTTTLHLHFAYLSYLHFLFQLLLFLSQLLFVFTVHVYLFTYCTLHMPCSALFAVFHFWLDAKLHFNASVLVLCAMTITLNLI